MSAVQNHFEINVSMLHPDGYRKHLFATDERSCVNKEAAIKVYKEIKSRFKEPIYQVDVCQIHCHGEYLDVKDWIK